MQIQLHTFRLTRTNTVEPVSVGFLHANTFSSISLHHHHHHRTKTAISTKRGTVLLELLGLNKWTGFITFIVLFYSTVTTSQQNVKNIQNSTNLSSATEESGLCWINRSLWNMSHSFMDQNKTAGDKDDAPFSVFVSRPFLVTRLYLVSPDKTMKFIVRKQIIWGKGRNVVQK